MERVFGKDCLGSAAGRIVQTATQFDETASWFPKTAMQFDETALQFCEILLMDEQRSKVAQRQVAVVDGLYEKNGQRLDYSKELRIEGWIG